MLTIVATLLAMNGLQANALHEECDLAVESLIRIPEVQTQLRLVARTVGQQCEASSTLVQVFAADDRLLYTYAVQTVYLSSHEDWNATSTHRVLREQFSSISASPITEQPPVSEIIEHAARTPEVYDLDVEAYSDARREGGWVVCFPQYWEGSRCAYLDPDRSVMYDLFKQGV